MNRNHSKLLLGLAALLGIGVSIMFASRPAAHAQSGAHTAVLAEVADWQGVDQVSALGDRQIQAAAGPLAIAGTEGRAAPLATSPSPGPVPRTPESPSSSVSIDRIYTTDANGYPKTTFVRGETIQFVARLLNRSISTQRVLAEFHAAEPGWFPWCELSCRPLHRIFRGNISVPRGLWTYAVRARTSNRDPIGQWSYRMTITLGSFSQTKTTPFRLR